MKKDKKNQINYRAIALIVIIIGLIVFLIINANKTYKDKILLPQYIYDTSTKEKVIGASDYTFVAKVNKLIRVEHIKEESEGKLVDYTPYSVYLVSVLKNIKGTLVTDRDIEVKLLGGIHRSENYKVLVKNLKYLDNDNHYILHPSADAEGNLIITNPDEIYSLGKEYDEKAEIIKEYVKAYKNEEVPTAEYYSIPKERQYSIYDEVKKH